MWSKSRGSCYSDESCELVIAWFQNNYMKLNTDTCHLLVAGHKSEHTWVRVGPDKIWEDHSIKLLGVSIDNELKFDKYVLNKLKNLILSSAQYQEWPNLWPSKRKGHFIKHSSSPNLSTVLWLGCSMVVKLIMR